MGHLGQPSRQGGKDNDHRDQQQHASNKGHGRQINVFHGGLRRSHPFHHEEQQAKWQVSSDHGVMYPDDKVVLEQQVILDNLKSGELFNKLETSQLEYLFEQQLIQTKQQVVISGDGFAINGSGVEVDLVSQKLQLNQHKGTVYRHEK